jgi:hypothetical protein
MNSVQQYSIRTDVKEDRYIISGNRDGETLQNALNEEQGYIRMYFGPL